MDTASSIPASKRQLDYFSSQISSVLEGSKILPHLRGSEFAEQYFSIASEAKGATTGRWKCRPWQRDILDVYNSIEYSGVVWLKPSRTGASKMSVATLVQAAADHKFNTLTYQPDDGDAELFVKTEIDPVLRDCEILQPLKMTDSKKFDTLTYKQLIGSAWHFLGGTSPKNYRGRSVDLVIFDEISGFPPEIGKDGDARSQGKVRITESPFGKHISHSSPLEMPGCQITEALKECDYVFNFWVPCPGCKKRQYIDFFEDGSKGVRWDMETKGLNATQRARTACFRCEHCEKDFTYAQTQNAQDDGIWRTEDGKHWLDKGRVFNKHGHQNQRRWVVGFISNCFISPAYSFENFASDYMVAKAAMDAGREGLMKTLHQTRLGRAWVVDQAVTNIDYRTIRHKNAIPYPADGTIPEQILAITSQCDVQGDRVEVFDTGWAEGEESFQLAHTVLPGSPDKPHVWQSLKDYWTERFYTTEGGRELQIYLHGIDHGGHWTDAVEKFCAEMGPREFLAIKGRLGWGEPVATFPRKPKQSGCWLVLNNTDTTKLTIMKRLAYERDEELWVNPGVMNFPEPAEGYEMFDERYYRQLTAESRIIRPSGKPEWKQNGLNEVFDGVHMGLCLIRVAQMGQYGLELKNKGNVGKRKKSKYDLADVANQLRTRSR